MHTCFYRGKLPEFLQEFASCEEILGMRFHSLILALKFRQKLFPVVYNDKSRNLLEDLGVFREDESWDIHKEQPPEANKILEVLERPQDFEETIQRMEKEAVRHFEKLDELMREQKGESL